MKIPLMLAATVGAALLTALTLSAQAKSQWDGIYTVEQAARGKTLYMRKCAHCHGETLAGYKDIMIPAPTLTGVGFAVNWNDFTLGDLVEKIQTTMPDDEPGTLTASESVDVLAFVLNFGGYPAGRIELPSTLKELREYRFLAKKPVPRLSR